MTVSLKKARKMDALRKHLGQKCYKLFCIEIREFSDKSAAVRTCVLRRPSPFTFLI